MKAHYLPLARFILLGTTTVLTAFLFASLLRPDGAPADPSIDQRILQTVQIEAPVLQQAVTGVITFPPRSSASRHLQHGIESGYVLSGDVEIVSDGEPSRIYHAGDTFVTHRDQPHVSRNAGATEASALVTWVVDADGPLTVPVA